MAGVRPVAASRRHWRAFRPRHLDWWVGAVISPGALCFLLAPIEPIADALGETADVWAFFVGSVFFTASGTLQTIGAAREQEPSPRRLDLWSSGVQLLGMLMFNLSTFAATRTDLSGDQVERLVWQPDMRGSICFLVAAVIACLAVGQIHWPPHSRTRWTATINLLGCIFFLVSAIAAYVLPDGELLRAVTANRFTSFGAACFLICAVRAMADADLEVGITPKRIEMQEQHRQQQEHRQRERDLEGHTPAGPPPDGQPV
jgi:hypothetical protein